MTKKEFEIPPLRSLDDFLLGSARFQVPNYKDLEKWGNRVSQNLIYYQTNYFFIEMISLLAAVLLHPIKMICGALSLFILCGIFYYFFNESSPILRFERKHPLMKGIVMFSCASLFFYLLDFTIVYLFWVLFPIVVIFIHASLRLRNLKNKLSNIERLISNKTPMGAFLSSLDVDIDCFS